MQKSKVDKRLDAAAQSLGFHDYAAYLNSDHWRDFKETYRKSLRPQSCLCCGNSRYCLHHTTYERLGREQTDDVVPLCGPCHKAVHRVSKQYKIKLSDVGEAIKAVQRGRVYCPEPRQLTKKNSTKKQRKSIGRQRRTAMKLLRSSRLLLGKFLVQCLNPACGKRGRQDGEFCCLCGAKCKIISQG